MEITLPNNWTPRHHQRPVWDYMQKGGTRASLCWHRRAGKDSFSINFLATYAAQHIGLYWHMLPSATQARKVIWNGIDGEGRRILYQAFPRQLIKRENASDMLIELFNGSIIQFVGSDNYDSLVGAGTKGVIFSEYAIADPRAWDYIRPMLKENNGWAIFISTPRGHNHFYTLHHNAEKSDRWFTERLTVDDTFRNDGSPIFSADQIEEEREEGMSEEMIQQEYYCSWEGGLEGAYYTKELAEIREKRLGDYPPTPYQNGISVWDLGVRDRTCIGIFHALDDGTPVLTEVITDRNKGLDRYITTLRNTPYSFNNHFAPHDIEQREFTSGKTKKDLASKMGIEFDVAPNISIHDGINAARAFLKVLHVNKTAGTLQWLDDMAGYIRKFDAKNNVYMDKPLHNYASDSADMLRYASLSYDPDLVNSERYTPPKVEGRLNG